MQITKLLKPPIWLKGLDARIICFCIYKGSMQKSHGSTLMSFIHYQARHAGSCDQFKSKVKGVHYKWVEERNIF